MPLQVFNDNEDDIAGQLFDVKRQKLILKRTIIPSMATLDTDIIRQDCLFYIMEEMPLHRAHQETVK